MKQDQAKVGDKSISGWGVEITDGLAASTVLSLLHTATAVWLLGWALLWVIGVLQTASTLSFLVV